MGEVYGDGGHDGSVEEVRCEFQYSRVAAAFIAFAVAATMLIVVLVPFPDAARLAACAFLAGAAHAHRRIGALRELKLDCAGAIQVREGERWRTGMLRGGSFVAPWLTIVRWRPDGARFDRTLLLLPDMADREPLRRIRVILRWAWVIVRT